MNQSLSDPVPRASKRRNQTTTTKQFPALSEIVFGSLEGLDLH